MNLCLPKLSPNNWGIRISSPCKCLNLHGNSIQNPVKITILTQIKNHNWNILKPYWNHNRNRIKIITAKPDQKQIITNQYKSYLSHIKTICYFFWKTSILETSDLIIFMILEVKGAPFGARHVDMTWHDMTRREDENDEKAAEAQSMRRKEEKGLTSNPRTLAYSRANQLRGRIDSGRFSSVKIRTWTCMRESIYTCMNTRGQRCGCVYKILQPMCVHILHERVSNFANGQWKFGPDVAVGPHAPTQVSTKYMSCEPYLLHNAIDGVFLPRSPVP